MLFDLIEHATFTDAEPIELERRQSGGGQPSGLDGLAAYLEEERPKLAIAHRAFFEGRNTTRGYARALIGCTRRGLRHQRTMFTRMPPIRMMK